MLKKYAIQITEKNLDLIMFLNDGVRPKLEEKTTYFICEINAPREITATIKTEDELYDENGLAKETMTWLL